MSALAQAAPNPFVGTIFQQLAALVTFVLVFGLLVAALASLRYCKVASTAKALWALVISFAPVVGSVAYFIVRPREIAG